MSGDQAQVEEKKTLFWPLNLLPGLTHIDVRIAIEKHFLQIRAISKQKN